VYHFNARARDGPPAGYQAVLPVTRIRIEYEDLRRLPRLVVNGAGLHMNGAEERGSVGVGSTFRFLDLQGHAFFQIFACTHGSAHQQTTFRICGGIGKVTFLRLGRYPPTDQL
jgi:hypothetical protein